MNIWESTMKDKIHCHQESALFFLNLKSTIILLFLSTTPQKCTPLAGANPSKKSNI